MPALGSNLFQAYPPIEATQTLGCRLFNFYYFFLAVSILPTGYVPINGGVIKVMGKDYVTNILGYWKFPKDVKQKCDDTCDCLVKW